MEHMNQNNYGLLAAALVLGLVIGSGAGYYYGLAKVQGNAAKVPQTTTTTATSSNPYTQIQTNPYSNIKVNPFQ